MVTTEISRYALYGEEENRGAVEFLHIEDIESRSRLYEWHITPHVHRHMFQLVYIHQGSATVLLDGQRQEIAGPCAVAIPGSVVHGFSFLPGTDGWVLTVSEQLLLQGSSVEGASLFTPFLRHAAVIPLTDTQLVADNIQRTLHLIAGEFHRVQVGQPSMLQWYCHIILVLLGRQWDAVVPKVDVGGKRRRLFTRFSQMVEDHYRSHKTIAEYAEALAMSQAQLNRLCKAFYGKGASRMVQERLLHEAQRYLTYTSATAQMIAYELGYQDPAYFSRFFKKFTGISPGAYRRMVLERTL